MLRNRRGLSEDGPSTELHLLLAILKNDQFDQALRFAAETRCTYDSLSCERSVPRYAGIKLVENVPVGEDLG